MTKLQTINVVDTGLATAINLLLAIQQGSQIVKQAQDEGWTDDDSRWAQPWADVDKALQDAKARLT